MPPLQSYPPCLPKETAIHNSVLIILLPQIYVARNTTLFSFACFWTFFYKWNHSSPFQFSLLNFSLSILRFNYSISLLCGISLREYIIVYLPRLLSDSVLDIVPVFASAHGVAMNIPKYFFWGMCARVFKLHIWKWNCWVLRYESVQICTLDNTSGVLSQLHQSEFLQWCLKVPRLYFSASTYFSCGYEMISYCDLYFKYKFVNQMLWFAFLQL